MLSSHRRWTKRLAIAIIAILPACDSRSNSAPSTQSAANAEVVLYCSVDIAFATPLFEAFEKQSGIRVHATTDTEAGKTTGLVNKLRLERDHPRADVWWSSEIFGTLQLAAEGILAPYEPSTTADIPAAYRDPAGLWTAFALRGRVLAYDPTRLAADQLPTAWHHVTDPRFKGRFAMADPRFGTTRGHMAALLDLWGKDAVRGFYESLRANEFIRADGNAHAVRLLALGRADLVATDTDDVLVAQKNGQSIAMIFPDHDAPDDGRKTPGTLWIPNSVALVRGAPHPEAARKLIDFIASEEIERRLFAGESRNVPVRPRLREELGATLPAEATIDYAAAAARLAASDDLVTEVLLK